MPGISFVHSLSPFPLKLALICSAGFGLPPFFSELDGNLLGPADDAPVVANEVFHASYNGDVGNRGFGENGNADLVGDLILFLFLLILHDDVGDDVHDGGVYVHDVGEEQDEDTVHDDGIVGIVHDDGMVYVSPLEDGEGVLAAECLPLDELVPGEDDALLEDKDFGQDP